MRALSTVILVCAATVARGEATSRSLVTEALERFEFGDYEGVVTLLRPVVDTGAIELEDEDRLEALRTYGIACVLTGRRVAAEGAFVLILRADSHAQLDPALVRPEAVTFFEEVRARHRAELVATYRKARGKRYWILNFLPPAGQFQNRQRAKGFALLGVEVALLATNIVTGALLNDWEGEGRLFRGHESEARALIPINIAAFAGFLTVVAYGIIDGFVVGQRLAREEKRTEERMLSRLSFGPGSLSVMW